jgi:hypothetical protein
MFSVVIPTIRKSANLDKLMAVYSAHPMVTEVLIVNNSGQPLQNLTSKVREIYCGPNIYVNPAWNMGARAATGEVLALSNDDIVIDGGLLDYVADFLLKKSVGVVGVGRESIEEVTVIPGIRREHIRNPYFGTLIFIPRENYIPVPSDLLIYCGDDWLFYTQRRENWAVAWPMASSEMNASVGSSSRLMDVARSDTELWAAKYWPKLRRRPRYVLNRIADKLKRVSTATHARRL